jgi:hypothetical protein
VADNASFESPLLPPLGVHHVFVNGRHVIEDGRLTEARPGLVVSVK